MAVHTINSLMDGKIVTTFYTNPSPSASWERITGTFTPLLGMFSAMLGPFLLIGGAALSVASSIMQDDSANRLVSSIAPVVNKRFSEYSAITAFVDDTWKLLPWESKMPITVSSATDQVRTAGLAHLMRLLTCGMDILETGFGLIQILLWTSLPISSRE